MNQSSFIILLIILIMIIACESKKSTIDLEESSEVLKIFSPDFISTSLYERDIAISSDGSEIIYTIGNYKQSKRCLVRVRKKSKYSYESEILPFSGKYHDIEPFYSPDGLKLYFASTRPIYGENERNDYNIWVSERESGEWGSPTSLDSIINTRGNEYFPSLSNNGNLYFTAIRENGIGSEDIFLSRLVNGKYTMPISLDSNINTTTYEFNAYISPKEDLLIFSSFGRLGELGGGDLYFSTKNEDGNWAKSKNMGDKINSDRLDYCPFIDFPRNNFYFTSDRIGPNNQKFTSVPNFVKQAHSILNGMGNIYRINLDETGLIN